MDRTARNTMRSMHSARLNEDKHRTVLPLAVGIPDDSEHPPQFAAVNARNVELTNAWVQITPKPLKDGAQVMGADATIPAQHPHVEVEIDLPFDIAFGEPMVTVRRPCARL